MTSIYIKRYLVLFIGILFIFFVTPLSTNNVNAQNDWQNTDDTTTQREFPNPLGSEEGSDDPNVLIGKVINAALGVVGSLALLMFIYGGFTWMLAAGNNEKVEKGKNILIWATLGLVVIFSAYAIVNFVLTEALGLG
jgi:hypothetical protein